MNKRDLARLGRLLPGGKPEYVRVYDNGGETADRYTVVFNGKYRTLGRKAHTREPLPPVQYVNMSGAPYHPQGVCQHGEAHTFFDAPEGWTTPIGRRRPGLGLRIPFHILPADCQNVVLEDYLEIWDIEKVAQVFKLTCLMCSRNFRRAFVSGTQADALPLYCTTCQEAHDAETE